MCIILTKPINTLWAKGRFFNTLKSRERERKSITLLEGSQATPARPSGRNNVKVKTLW
jgi:hypothetical protein